MFLHFLLLKDSDIIKIMQIIFFLASNLVLLLHDPARKKILRACHARNFIHMWKDNQNYLPTYCSDITKKEKLKWNAKLISKNQSEKIEMVLPEGFHLF